MEPYIKLQSHHSSLKGFIDAGSLSGAIAAFHFQEPKDTYSWSWQNAIEVTSALINTKHIRVSPEPNPLRPPTEPYGPVYKEFSPVLDIVHPSEEILSWAHNTTKKLVDRNRELILKIYDANQNDQKGFGNWIDWVISKSWVNHSKRKGGICDNVFLPEVANVLEISESDLRETQKLSACPRSIQSLVRTRQPAYEFDLLVDAFIISALIRGIYYACVAHKTNSQLLYHQTRDALFRRSSSKHKIEYSLSNTEQFLSTIIVASVFREKNHRQRIEEWAKAILKVRQAVHEGRVDLRFKEFDSSALDEAIRIAKLINISTKSKWINKGVNAGVAIGVGILTSFVLSPWAGFFAGLSSGYTMEKIQFGDKVKNQLESSHRFREIASAEAGSISRSWAGGLQVMNSTKTTKKQLK